MSILDKAEKAMKQRNLTWKQLRNFRNDLKASATLGGLIIQANRDYNMRPEAIDLLFEIESGWSAKVIEEHQCQFYT